uniref:Uncharacterized protein n=1 Tax=viral metagenome TaxID=1070528 RepID=A0A6M3LVI5_9ZZZZ
MPDYTLRDIPSDLHRAWKASSAMSGMSMRDYAFVSLQMKIAKDLKKETDSDEKHRTNVG